jgi:hypothetical protein
MLKRHRRTILSIHTEHFFTGHLWFMVFGLWPMAYLDLILRDSTISAKTRISLVNECAFNQSNCSFTS